MVEISDMVLISIIPHLTEQFIIKALIYYMGLKVFNSLPSYIKDKLQDIKEFKQLIKNFLYSNTFYTMDEYFNYNKKGNTW